MEKVRFQFRFILFSLLGLILTATLVFAGYKLGQRQTQPVVQPILTPTPTIEVPSTKASCEQAGGKWETWRDIPEVRPECNLPTSDAGKECIDSSQCESYCQAEKGAKIGLQTLGKCYGWKIAICMQEVREGIVQPEWCF